jgi:CubicO group peptidase (beta-lactamase class C family)
LRYGLGVHDSDVTTHWTIRLRELAKEYRVPGAVLGIWADRQLTVAAHGVLSHATHVEVTADSLFQIGSITKVWTTTMIMQLIEEGRLSLDTTVAEVLPGVRIGTPDGSGEITIRHLVTHSSGIDGDVLTDTGRGSDCLERYAALLGGVPRTFTPGAAFSYCNSGFMLLGRIVEALDGGEWDQSLRRRLIGPLGLKETVTLPEEAILHRAAVGHREFPNENEPYPIWAIPRSSGPAGVITASAHDVLTFARMHMDGGVSQDGTRVLGQDLVQAMQQPQISIPTAGPEPEMVGLAWMLTPWDGKPVIGHDGSTIGQASHLRIAPDAGVAVCLLTNASSARALYQALFAEVFREYTGMTLSPSPGPTAEPVNVDLERHVGHYERTSHSLDVSLRDGKLHVVSTMTGELAAFNEVEPEELDLHPADSSGDHFVARSHDHQPWVDVNFGQLADGTPYILGGGRVTPRVE